MRLARRPTHTLSRHRNLTEVTKLGNLADIVELNGLRLVTANDTMDCASNEAGMTTLCSGVGSLGHTEVELVNSTIQGANAIFALEKELRGEAYQEVKKPKVILYGGWPAVLNARSRALKNKVLQYQIGGKEVMIWTNPHLIQDHNNFL